MIERIVSKDNMAAAYDRVTGNKGCAGSDGMETVELKPYLKLRWPEIRQSILDGSYRPKPVLGVEIDKPKGGKRLLGIPTVVDRLIQQAIQQVLSERFDAGFSPLSFGFRKGIRTRIRNLIKLGLEEWLAVKWGFTRRGGWHVVQSPILQTTITNKRLQKRGFTPTSMIYDKFSHV